MRGAAELAGLTAVPVDSETTAWVMARIRNECRAGFSADNAVINYAQQCRWWAENARRVSAWLYATASPLYVGFGLLRPQEADGGPSVTSVAVLPEFAGKGYGKAITRDLVERAGERLVLATARLDNPAAVKLHDAAYWDRTDGPDERLAYFRALSPPARHSLAAWREAEPA